MQAQGYDDRDGFIWLDGDLVAWRDARVHLLTHALHYASSVFEGQRAYGGRIFRLTEHSQRLLDSAATLGMTLPWSRAQIDAACIETLEKNGLSDCYMRPIAWRGTEQMGVSASRGIPHLAIACWPAPSYFPEAQVMKGLRLEIATFRRPPPETAPVQAKAAGLYMICTIAKNAAESAGYDDAMMLDWRGQIAEATGANLFFVRERVLHTPYPDCFLDGITRRTVITLARARGLDVVERAIWPDELATFDEAFLTGTAAEVAPISEIGARRFAVGEISRMLRDDYAALVRRMIPA